MELLHDGPKNTYIVFDEQLVIWRARFHEIGRSIELQKGGAALPLSVQAQARMPDDIGEVCAEKTHSVVLLADSRELLEKLPVEVLNYVIELRRKEHSGANV